MPNPADSYKIQCALYDDRGPLDASMLDEADRWTVLYAIVTDPDSPFCDLASVSQWLGLKPVDTKPFIDEAWQRRDSGEQRGNLADAFAVCERLGYRWQRNEWRYVGRTKIPVAGGILLVDALDVTGENLPPLPPAIVDGIMHAGEVHMLSAPSKAGKTHLAISLACAIASGNQWLGEATHARPVIYANMEVHHAWFDQRLDRILRAGRKPERGMLRVLNGRGSGYDAARIADYADNADSERNALLIVDSLYNTYPPDANENDAGCMGAVMREFQRFVGDSRRSVVLIHHATKGATGSKQLRDRMAGSGVFARSVDGMLALDELDVQDGTELASQLDESGARPLRLSFLPRNVAPHAPVDLYLVDGRIIPATGSELSELPIVGSPQAGARRGGNANSARAEADRDRKAELIRECIDACATAGIPSTRANVLDLYNERAASHGLDEASASTFKRWTAPSGPLPFRVTGSDNIINELPS